MELCSLMARVRTLMMAPLSSMCAPRCRNRMMPTAMRTTTSPTPKVIRNWLLRMVGRSPGSYPLIYENNSSRAGDTRSMLWTAPAGKTLKLMVGDITRVPADAMVNAANSALMGGGGVDGAIHRAGGPSIMEELDRIRERIGRCPTGSVVATAAGALPARWVFHAVGPVYAGGLQ